MSDQADDDSAAPGSGSVNNQWLTLVGKVGADIAEPLTDALEQVHALAVGGRIDPSRVRKLRSTIEQARQVGMAAQQLTRFASRRIRVSHERLQLDAMLMDVVLHRSREAEAKGLAMPSSDQIDTRPAEVLADASLLFSLLNTMFDWVLRHARSQLRFSVDIKTWPANARLRCSFDTSDGAAEGRGSATAAFDSLTWRLIEQIAHTMDLVMVHTADGPLVELSLEFPRTANHSLEGVSSVDLSDSSVAGPNSMPLVGSHVLILASRRAVRMQIRNAIHHMGLLVDLVSSVEEAIDFCQEAVPHAIVFEGILEGERLAQLRSELWAEVPNMAFVEITEEGHAFEMSDARTGNVACVGREALETSLPSVLLFELSRAL